MGNHWKSFTQLNSSPGRDEAEFPLFFLLEADSVGFFPPPSFLCRVYRMHSSGFKILLYTQMT